MASSTQSSVSRTLINQVVDWVMEQALADIELEPLLNGCCERLHAAGVPIVRAFFGFSVLHPLHSATSVTWTRGTGGTHADYPHQAGRDRTSGYYASPFYYMEQRNLDTMRVCLDCADRRYDFQILKELQEQGITDYLAFRIPFSTNGRDGMTGSWSTDHGSGFKEDDISALLRVQSRLALAAKVALRGKLMRNVAWTYLGRHSGSHVLSGQIKRGDGQTIRAAIWHADMRGSTSLADRLPRQEYIDTLNQFFDASGGAVLAAGGEILSFIGDGVLAIFPTIEGERTAGKACSMALQAAMDAERRLADVNATRRSEGKDPLGYGIALHLGNIMYGNVGVAERLSFSAFGSAVNEVTRLDQLTKTLREPVLASETFATRVGHHEWKALGAHRLRGIGRKIKVFAPTRDARIEAAVGEAGDNRDGMLDAMLVTDGGKR